MTNVRSVAPQSFGYWCQKVLPLVYDDSLSYYEILCKIVEYVNKMIEEENQANQKEIAKAKSQMPAMPHGVSKPSMPSMPHF